MYLLLVNLATMLLYGADKAKAKRGTWRISEKILLGAGVCGGAPGALVAMHLFHHKTRHWYFYAVNLTVLLVQAVWAVCWF